MTFWLEALGIGLVAGLRSLTAPAAVSWAAWLTGLDLEGSPLAFMASKLAVVIFTLAALAEYVADLLPGTPNRTRPGPLIGRLVLGGFSGACLAVAGRHPLVLGVILGGIGALIGAFGGYEIRSRLVRRLNIRDAFVAIPEDLVAMVLAYLIVAR